MRLAPHILLRFMRHEGAVAILEFAIVLPLLLVLLLGMAEYSRYSRYLFEVQAQAQLMAQDIAGFDTPTPGFWQIANVNDSAFYNMPSVQADAAAAGKQYWQVLGYQITSVAMTPTVAGCTSNCTYQANVAFVYSSNPDNSTLGSLTRGCGTLTPGGTDPTPTTLPASYFQPGSLILVDVAYNYAPLFGTSFFPARKIIAHAFAVPTHVSTYIGGGAIGSRDAFVCPGY